MRVGLLGLWALVGGSGCATCPQKLSAALRQPRPERVSQVANDYTVACPDVLRVTATGHAPVNVPIEADGCIAIPTIGRIRVDGSTTSDIATLISREIGTVTVNVVEHSSRHILLFGPGDGVQQVVPYVGPESVTDLLRRTGGLPTGAAFRAVHVVRPHVAGGHRPEVFVVDLESILSKNEAATDVKLMPYDQVYVGQTKGAAIARSLPPWMRKVLPGMSSLDEHPEMPNNTVP
ncbi:MAG: polysaccharide biosynthesis/export family protein [Gemmataceae bacterium]|nr:polysaccharide biosynthesis/export family protein [Gemmataceae bacterium]